MAKKINKKTMNKGYDFAINAIKRFFSQYYIEDIAIAILSSEMWLPNRASGVKHQLCWGVFASMTAAEFRGRNNLKIYSEYLSFTRTLYSLLPNFPMLEDFVPQDDWGEIRVVFNNEILPIFYGGNVERITDFINAFEIQFSSIPFALKDMELALRLQSHFVLSVDKKLIGNGVKISSGHLSLPSEKFWQAIKDTVVSIKLNSSLEERVKIRSISFGEFEMPKTEEEFGNAILDGSFQKFVCIKYDEKWYPTSIRNLTNIMMVCWENEELPEESFEPAVQALSWFIHASMQNSVPGPNMIFKNGANFDPLFSSFFISNEVLYIPLPVKRELVEELHENMKSLVSYFEEMECLEFFNLNLHHILKLDQKYSFRNDNVRILIVILDVSTSPAFHSAPEHPAYLISISDFITLLLSLGRDDSLDDVLSFNKNVPGMTGMIGIIDLLGAYRDSNSILVEGANMPDQIFLDPHYGCEWRYKDLIDYWELAPEIFPARNLCWEMGSQYDGIASIYSKSHPIGSWYTRVGKSEVHFMCAPFQENLNLNNTRVLTLAIECFADAFQQRNSIIANLPIFQGKPIIINCVADENSLSSVEHEEVSSSEANDNFIISWFYPKKIDSTRTCLTISLNLNVISNALRNSKNAAFQAIATNEIVSNICAYCGVEYPKETRHQIESTSNNPARMTIEVVEQTISVPEIPSHKAPLPKHYKLARKEIAFILKQQNVLPGIYELNEAKKIIDKAKLAYRDSIHSRLQEFDRNAFLKLCVEQHDRLSSEHRVEKARIAQSLKHEVSFDRQSSLGKKVEEFVKCSRNYRYVIEAFISQPKYGSQNPELEDFLSLTGKVDWLMVLYQASDVLHNDIDVGGITISEEFVPEVFYSNTRVSIEEEFRRHDASSKLGINVNHSDELRIKEKSLLLKVQEIFLQELGFEYSLLLEVLEALSKWTSFGEKELPAFSYIHKKAFVARQIANALKEDDVAAVASTLDFLTLNPSKVRLLTGIPEKQDDVPIWEHNKRAYRYTIRPLLPVDDSLILWGADAAKHAHTIWFNTVHNGYLPADFGISKIDNTMRSIKESLEKNLEILAHEITSRFSTYSIAGIDFYRRFPRQKFEDVGDFDVLAYWPESNLWVTIECKYIQPPFCIKDSRRLRDKMFDPSKGKSHLCKIAKRRKFLQENFGVIREVLGWPSSSSGTDEKIKELYVSKDSYWWMFATPYSVPTEFVQIDLLENWFKEFVVPTN
jgi:hypothetical protein